MSLLRGPGDHFRAFFKLTSGCADKFDRTRTWSARSVLMWLMVLTMPDRKMSYRRSLRIVAYYGRKVFDWAKVPTLSSISEARKKVSIETCRGLLHQLVERCESIMPTPKTPWGKRRFIAFDGTRVVLPRSADTARKMARPKRPNGTSVHNPQGLVVMAADVFRRLPLDWSLTGKGIGERTSMQKLVHRLPFKAGDVAVMDRGFPSRHLFSALIEHGVDIIARMSASKATAWKELKPFLSSNKKTAQVTLTLPGAKGNIELQVRVVERDAKPGRPRKGTKNERMVIVSTLSGKDGFDRKDIIKLYASRWGIESLFKEMKSFMQTEDFHSKSVQGCEQELISAMIWIALASFLQAEAERTLDGRRVVRADCLRAAGDLLFAMLSGKSIHEQMDDDIAALRMFAYAPQQDRHYPRECKRPFGRTIQRGGA
ncbi:MAG: IS4 family transposase [Myxococcales bacterium]|nr:IS4 family transposase [Myxococcales bacterium]